MSKQYIKGIILILGCMLVYLKPSQAQQNIQFTQYIFNSLSVNPAYAGYKEEWFGQMALRSQWTGLKGAPNTGQFSIDGIVDPLNKRMGLGLQVSADKLGPQSANSVYANYAYRLRLNADDTERLSFGLGLGVTSYGLDGTVLSPVDPDDQNLPVGQVNRFIPDARFGAYYYNAKFYVGASVMDLFSGSGNLDIFKWGDGSAGNIRRQRHFYLIAGMLNQINDEIKFRPSILLKEDFKGPSSIDLSGMIILHDKLWLGASYRTGVKLWDKKYAVGQDLSMLNSVSGVAQLYISSILRVGYSYDYMINSLSSAQSGTHEITLGITFPRGANRLLSPRFF